LELMLFIHEFRREPLFESGGVVPVAFFSVLPRLSSAGRFGAIRGGVVAVELAVDMAEEGRGGDAGRMAAGVGS
jgi:hypothetical protein